jgi:cytochrome P450
MNSGMTAVEDGAFAEAPEHGYDPFDYRLHEDPYPVYAWMREHAPLYRNEERDFWALSRHADVRGALRQPELFSSRNGISLEPELWGPHAVKTSFFLAMDPPEHGPRRSLVSSAFTPRLVAGMEPRIREITRALLEVLRGQPRFDFAADYAAALPNDVLCEMLGVPEADWDLIRADTDALSVRQDRSDERGPSSTAAALRMAEYFVDLVTELRRRPGEDVTSALIKAEVHGERLTDSEIVGFLFVLVGAGNDSTGKTIGNAWYHGWLHPEVQQAGLNGRAADWATETLRYDPAAQLVARYLTQDTEIYGIALKEGARIAILPASANRDRRVFAEPDRYHLDRADAGRLISFGQGPHHCLGAALARLEMRIALEEISALVSCYEIDIARAHRVHSPYEHGFVSLPCEVTFRLPVQSAKRAFPAGTGQHPLTGSRAREGLGHGEGQVVVANLASRRKVAQARVQVADGCGHQYEDSKQQDQQGAAPRRADPQDDAYVAGQGTAFAKQRVEDVLGDRSGDEVAHQQHGVGHHIEQRERPALQIRDDLYLQDATARAVDDRRAEHEAECRDSDQRDARAKRA